ncbi:MAG: 16S rRNA (guanine(527)-N(7))-methyltransferase RsmG [Sulfurospirillaceae bacterium]|nr:16S rRNA (guanine(527)-N(7))-methyltransferase RsmG [Sulfurospirillaceae bacterium]
MIQKENHYALANDFNKKCENFTRLILNYNKIHNITGAKDASAIKANIEDSIYPIKFLPDGIKNAIDVGTGAGFPGLLLAIALPQIHFTLFEPIKKKSSFLHLAKSALNLQNVDIISQRVEKVEAFDTDLICSRAVTKTDLLLKICKNFIYDKSILLFYKGTSVKEEIKDLVNYEIYKNGNRNYLIVKTKGNF